MLTIKKILMWEVLLGIAFIKLQVWQSVSHISYLVEWNNVIGSPKLKATM